ncbi:stimulated by retinoic acid gene 6 protein-like isoform X2 [Hydractinia symbiolongicarpus]|uniref:stimulated by retinoic acid gene 6 protein-like isoform X2 n=1 Tax=Hydractinia symbiolongicarpus TaxID=13093 RepID=UPI00254CAB94|nr:stimulated by retinoic acid gene 6 protein-like isoform X2 [Hydractinia symbiolongicarpus]
MLPVANLALIAGLLMQFGIEDVTNPTDMLKKLNELSKEVDRIHNETGVSKEELEAFFNTTLPCMQRILKRDIERGVSPDATLRSLTNDCLYADRKCYADDNAASIFWGMQLCAFIFQIIISFSHRRKRLYMNCCKGHPGLVIPVNMLDGYENRVGVALAFGLTITQCYYVLFSDYNKIFGTKIGAGIRALPSYASVFIKILCAIFISQMAYPFFVCQKLKNRIVGAVNGVFLCVLWLSLEIQKIYVNVTTCWEFWEKSGFGRKYGLLSILYDIPLYICLVLLLFKFIMVLVSTIKIRRKKLKIGVKLNWFKQDDTDWKSEYVYLHVKNLLKPCERDDGISFNGEDSDEENDVKIKRIVEDKVRENLYTYRPEFKYSTRMVASIVVAVLVIYTLLVSAVTLGYVLFIKYWKKIFTSNIIKVISAKTSLSEGLVDDYIKSVSAAWWLGIATAFIFSLIVSTNSMTWYRKHIMKLRKGERTFLPKALRNPNSVGDDAGSLMAASMKFAGFQVGYAAWGFILLSLLLFLCYYVLITQLIIPMKRGENSLSINIFIKVWPTLLITVAMMVVQKVMAVTCFLLNKDSLAVNNRRVFHLVSYLFFYFNIFLGMFSCLLRIIYGIIFGVVFIQRLQKSTLPRTLEEKDPGFYSYLGYILLEHQHANPVLHCFARLLLESRNKDFVEGEKYVTTTDHFLSSVLEVDQVDSLKKESIKVKRARTRWHLAYVLIKNPSLQRHRRSKQKVNKPRNLVKLIRNADEVNFPFVVYTGVNDSKVDIKMSDKRKRHSNSDGRYSDNSTSDDERNNSVDKDVSCNSADYVVNYKTCEKPDDDDDAEFADKNYHQFVVVEENEQKSIYFDETDEKINPALNLVAESYA